VSAWEQSCGASDEWFTPRYIFDALGETFDLDVAHPTEAKHCHVPAIHYFSRGALETPWFGFVWMNPPFGGRNSLGPWMDRFFAHGNGIALTPDRTSAPWFRNAWRKADTVLFTPKVKFIRPDGSIGRQPGTGTALWAAGCRAEEALARAASNGLGILGRPLSEAA
jgi:hypothetical protein